MMEMEQEGFSHIVVNIPKNSDNSRINIDVYNPRERSVTFPVPKWINFWRTVTVVDMTPVFVLYCIVFVFIFIVFAFNLCFIVLYISYIVL